MLIGIGCVLAIAIVIFGLPALRKSAQAREAREREEREKETAFMEAQQAYFAAQGIRIVDARMSPRVSDIGTVMLEHRTANHWQSDDDGSWHSQPIVCSHGCGTQMVFLSEVAPTTKDRTGAKWGPIGSYCAACGAWIGSCSSHTTGPLTRLSGNVTNIFDVLGDPKDGSSEGEWRRLGDEERELEARLNGVRARRLALAERLGKPIGSPFRPQIMSGGKES